MTISEETMNIYQRYWHYLGLWSLPLQPRHPRYTVYSVLANFTTLIVFNVCILLSILVANSTDDIIGALQISSGTITTAVKVLLFITSRRDVSQLMYLMKLLETVSDINPRERTILLAAKRKSVLARSFLLYSAYIAVTMLLLNAIIQPKRTLLLPSLYPFDWQSNIVWYGLAIIFQFICICHMIMKIMAVDMWRVAAVYMLAGFLDVLRGRMQRLGCLTASNFEKSQLITAVNKQHRFHEKELIDCVKYHLLCLRYFHVLEKACKLHYFCQLSSSSALIGGTVYLLTIFQPLQDVSKFIWLSGCLLCSCFQLAIPCYIGSYLADKSDQLSFNLYESNWPDMSTSFKSSMSIVLEVTKQPIIMCSAWNIFFISLPTFVSVMRSAHSMLSLLKGVE